jgi:GNAT superfamily N-acetyltransferase
MREQPVTLAPRDATRDDLEALAGLWFDGWQDAHADILAGPVAADRSPASFRGRLARSLGAVRTVGPPGEPLGFSLVRGDELYQFYVGRSARGTGLAAALMRDAEARMMLSGVGIAWLDCAIGNLRAARFYEKQGWRCSGNLTIALPLQTGHFPLQVWRFEKALAA